MRFTFDREKHSKLGSYKDPGFDIWIEVENCRFGYIARKINRDGKVWEATYPWVKRLDYGLEDNRETTVGRILADTVANICYPQGLSRPAKTALVKEIKSQFPNTVVEVLGLSARDVEDEMKAYEEELLRREQEAERRRITNDDWAYEGCWSKYL